MAKGRAVAIVLDDVERRELTALTRKHGAPQAVAERARIVLAAAGSLKNKEIASKLGVCTHTVGTWRNRFADHRMDGLYDEPRPGARARLATTKSRARSAKRWRRDQRVAPIGASGAWLKRSVMRLRRCIASGAPSVCNRTASRLSKLSTDPLFVEKVRDIVGLYLYPSALSCCVSMRKARCRRSTARNPCCRCGPDRPSGVRTIISGTERHRCSRHSM